MSVLPRSAALAALVVTACGPAAQNAEAPRTGPGDSVAAPTADSTGRPSSSTVSPGPAVTSQPALARLVALPTSGFTEPTELVLRDAVALERAWGTLYGGLPGNPPPTVDFTRDMVVLVALGERSTGGHTVRVESVTSAPGGATVRYTATRPGANCMTTQEITSPVEAVQATRVSGEVRFERRDVVQEC